MSWHRRSVHLDRSVEEMGVPQHHFFLAVLSDYIGSCVHFGGGLSVLEGQSSQSQKVATSLLFKMNCSVHQVLKVETWSSQSTFSSFYLRDVTHRNLVTFSIGPVVVAQKVV